MNETSLLPENYNIQMIQKFLSSTLAHLLNEEEIFSAEDYAIGSTHSRAILFYDGTVFWPPPTQLRSTCKTDVTYFPFDSQHCAIKFGSWTYHGVEKFQYFLP